MSDADRINSISFLRLSGLGCGELMVLMAPFRSRTHLNHARLLSDDFQARSLSATTSLLQYLVYLENIKSGQASLTFVLLGRQNSV